MSSNRVEVDAAQSVVEGTPPRGPAPRISPDGSTLLSARSRSRELFPSSWLRCRARVVYHPGGDGPSLDTNCQLLDTCSVGLIVGAKGGKVLLSWDAVRVVELLDGGA